MPPPREPHGTEKPSRVLFVRNINYNATEQEVREVFEKFGTVIDVFSRIESRGMAFITFSDIRHAEAALYSLQGTVIRDREIDIHYSLPRDADDKYYNRPESQQNDTLFVTVRGSTTPISNEDILETFGSYGDIKAIRDCPKSPAQKFVEYYDMLACQRALDELHNKAFNGGTLDIKYAIDRKREAALSRRDNDRDRDRGGDRGGNDRGGGDRERDRERGPGRNQPRRSRSKTRHRSDADPYPSSSNRPSRFAPAPPSRSSGSGGSRRPPPPRVEGAMNNLTSVLQEQVSQYNQSQYSPQAPHPNVPPSGGMYNPTPAYPPNRNSPYAPYPPQPPPASIPYGYDSSNAAAQLTTILGQLQQTAAYTQPQQPYGNYPPSSSYAYNPPAYSGDPGSAYSDYGPGPGYQGHPQDNYYSIPSGAPPAYSNSQPYPPKYSAPPAGYPLPPRQDGHYNSRYP